MKSEEIIMLVFVGIIVLAIPFVTWMIANEEKRKKEEETKLWLERKKKRDEANKR